MSPSTQVELQRRRGRRDATSERGRGAHPSPRCRRTRARRPCVRRPRRSTSPGGSAGPRRGCRCETTTRESGVATTAASSPGPSNVLDCSPVPGQARGNAGDQAELADIGNGDDVLNPSLVLAGRDGVPVDHPATGPDTACATFLPGSYAWTFARTSPRPPARPIGAPTAGCTGSEHSNDECQRIHT